MAAETIIATITVKKRKVEQLLQNQDVELKLLSDEFNSLTPLLKQLTMLAKTDEVAAQYLADLDIWYNSALQKVRLYKDSIADNLKKLSAARKADYNYRQNR